VSQGVWQTDLLMEACVDRFSSAPDSNVWPFAKLRNGFGSHRYLYSPILLDSQVLSSQTCKKNKLASSTRTSHGRWRSWVL